MRRAFNAGWYFDFTIAYIGAGFITPLAVNVSMMIGACLSWGLAWPLLMNRAGDWYPTGLAYHSFRGLFACEPSALPASQPIHAACPFLPGSSHVVSHL